MVDRDESALHHVQLSLDGEPIMDSPDLVLGDLRTPGFIDALFEETRPTIVFHAAALNSLPLTERFPDEAFLTNVVATRDLLLAASAYDVRRFVNISTDKAADPQGALGCSKRVAERLPRPSAFAWTRITVSSRCAWATCWSRTARCCRPSPPSWSGACP